MADNEKKASTIANSNDLNYLLKDNIRKNVENFAYNSDSVIEAIKNSEPNTVGTYTPAYKPIGPKDYYNDPSYYQRLDRFVDPLVAVKPDKEFEWKDIPNKAWDYTTTGAGYVAKGAKWSWNAVKAVENKRNQIANVFWENQKKAKISQIEGDLMRNSSDNIQSLEFVKEYLQNMRRLEDLRMSDDQYRKKYGESKQLIGSPWELDKEFKQLLKYKQDYEPKLWEVLNRSQAARDVLIDYDKSIGSSEGRTALQTLHVIAKEAANLFTLGLAVDKKDRINDIISFQGIDSQKKGLALRNPSDPLLYKDIDDKIKEAQDYAADKLDDLAENQQELKEGTWLFDPKSIDPKFREKIATTEFEFTSPSTYDVALAEAGTSFSEIVAMGGSFVNKFIAGGLNKWVVKGNPLATIGVAVAEAGADAWLTYVQRRAETDQNIAEAYIGRVMDLSNNGAIDLNAVLTDGARQIKDVYGIDPSNMDEQQILSTMLALNIKPEGDAASPAFEAAKLDALKGLNRVNDENMAQGLNDMMQVTMFSNFGKVAINAAGLNKVYKKIIPKQVANLTGKGNALIDRGIYKTLVKIGSNPAKAITRKRMIKQSLSTLKKIGIAGVLEGTEEGGQYLTAEAYKRGEYDNYAGIGTPLVDFTSSAVNDLKLGIESNLAMLGLHPEKALNNDADLSKSYKLGAALGGVFGGAHAITDTYNLIKQIKADKTIRAFTAQDYLNKEEDGKVDQYLNAVRKHSISRIVNSLEEIKKYNKPEGVTDEDIDFDIKNANKVYSLYNNSNIRNYLQNHNYSKDSDEAGIVIKNAVHIDNLADQYASDLAKVTVRLSEELSTEEKAGTPSEDGTAQPEKTAFAKTIDKLVESYITSPYFSSLSEEEYTERKAILAENLARAVANKIALQTSEKLLTQTETRKAQLLELKENAGIDIDVEDLDAVVDEILKDRENLESAKNEFEEATSVSFDQLPLPDNYAELEELIAKQTILTALARKARVKSIMYETGRINSWTAQMGNFQSYVRWDNLSEEDKQKFSEEYRKELVEKAREESIADSEEINLTEKEIASAWERKQQEKFRSEVEKTEVDRIITEDIQRYKKDRDSYNTEDPSNDPNDPNDPTPEEPVEEPSNDDPDASIVTTPEEPVEEVGTLDDIVAEEERKRDTETTSENNKPRKGKKTDRSKTIEELEAEAMTEQYIPNDQSTEETSTSDETIEENQTEEESEASITEDVSNEEEAEELQGVSGDLLREMQGKKVLPPESVTTGELLNENSTVSDESGSTNVEDAIINEDESTPNQPPRLPVTEKPSTETELTDEQDDALAREIAELEFNMSLQGEVSGEIVRQLIEDSWNNSGSYGFTTRQNLASFVLGKKGLIGNTLFYARNSTEPLNLGIKGLKSGKELAELLATPGSLKDAKLTFGIDTLGLDTSNVNNYGKITVYLKIETPDGNVYAATLKNEKGAQQLYDKIKERALNDLAQGKIRTFNEKAFNENRSKDIANLIKLRNTIISAILSGNTVSPVNVRLSNGTYSNSRSFRNLHDIKGFAIPSDPYSILTSVEFGFGRGPKYVAPYEITRLDRTGAISVPGRGFSGKLFIVPNLENVPSQRYSAAFMLSEKNFKGNRSLAEHILNLLTNQEENPIEGFSLLDLIVNNGEHTLQREVNPRNVTPYLQSKQLHYDAKTEILTIGTNTYQLQDILTKPAVKEEVLNYLMNNFHWNTNVDAMTAPINEAIPNTMIAHQQEKLILIPGEVEFTLEDVGLIKDKNGKIIKDPKHSTTPPLISWYIKKGKIISDANDNLFSEPFLYTDIDLRIEKPENAPEEANIAPKESDKKPNDTKPATDTTIAKQEKAASKFAEANIEAPKFNRFLTIEEMKELGFKAIKDAFAYDAEGNVVSIATRLNGRRGAKMTLPNNSRLVPSNTEGAVRWLMDKLGLSRDQIVVVNGVIRTLANGDQVLGVTNEDVITLSTVGVDGVEFHEAFHRVNLLLHTKEQRAEIYNEYVKQHKKEAKRSDETQKEFEQRIEERLAEEFRLWMINNNKPRYKILKYFRAIKEFVKKMLHISPNIINQTFNNIKTGKYRNVTIDQESLAEFNSKYKEGEAYYKIPGVEEKFESIKNPTEFYSIVDGLVGLVLSTYDIHDTSSIKKINFKWLRDNLQAQLNLGMIDERYASQVAEIISTDSKYNVFKEQVKDGLASLAITELEDPDAVENEKVAVDSGDINPNEIYDKASYEVSKKLNTTLLTKIFFYSIPKATFDYVIDDNGKLNRELIYIDNPVFGTSDVYSFDVAWNEILENLYNVEDTVELLNKISTLAESKPFFASLKEVFENRAPDENTLTQILMTIKSAKPIMFVSAFSKPKPKALSRAQMRKGKKAEKVGKAGEWSILDSNNFRPAKKYPIIWSELFYMSNLVDKTDPRNIKFNSPLITKIKANYAEIVSSLLNGKRLATIEEQDIVANEAKNDLVHLLNQLGIAIDRETIDYMLLDIPDNGMTKSTELNKVLTLTQGSEDGSLSYLIKKDIDSMKTAKGSRKTKTLATMYNKPSAGSFIEKAALAYAKTHPLPEEFSYLGPDGTSLYPITQNNYMTDQNRWLNSDPELVSNLLKIPYNSSSRILNHLLKGGKIDVQLYVGMKNNDTNSSRKYFDVSPIEEYVSKMVMTFKNAIILPTMADKPTWYIITGLRAFKNMLTATGVHTVIDSNGLISRVESPSDGVLHFNDEVLNTFYNYLLDEFNAIKDFYKNRQKIKDNPNLRIDNYHDTWNEDGTLKTIGNGGLFRYFSSMFIPDESGASMTKHSLNKLLIDANNQGNVDEVLAKLEEGLFGVGRTKEEQIFIKNSMLDAINRTLQSKVSQEINKLIELGIIKVEDGNLKNELIPTNILNYYQDLYDSLPTGHPLKGSTNAAIQSAIANHVVNTASSIIEFEKAFSSDPAFYKYSIIADSGIITNRSTDKIKRLSSVLSTGDNLRLWWGEGDPRNNTKFTVMNLKDNIVTSNQHSEIIDLFTYAHAINYLKKYNGYTEEQIANLDKSNLNSILKLLDKKTKKLIKASATAEASGYTKINQADASVYISPKMYKRIIQALGEWTPEVQEAFDLLESNEDWLNNPELYAKALAVSIKPLKMMYYGNSINSELQLNTPVFDKMAMFPMFKMLAKADNKLLYQRMTNTVPAVDSKGNIIYDDNGNEVHQELGEIDMVAFESAVKVGGAAKITFYRDDKSSVLNIEDLTKPNSTITPGADPNQVLPVYIQDLRYLRRQLNTDPHEHSDNSFGTQVVKIGMSNIIKNRIYGKNKGAKISGQTIINEIYGTINALSDKGLSYVRRELLNKPGEVSDTNLRKSLIRDARTSGMSSNLQEAIADGAPLSALSERKWVESKITSKVNKRTVDVVTPGGSAIQMSSFGFKAQIVTDSALNSGKPLSFVNKDGSMDCILSINMFKHVFDALPKEEAAIYKSSFTKARKFLIDNGIIGEKAKPFSIGYRIPTQGLSSIALLKVVDIMPSLIGDTIVLPDEFTAMTGSDFDIDKLYLASYNYEQVIDGDGTVIPGRVRRVKFNPNKKYRDTIWHANNSKALQNRLLDMYSLVIADDTNMDQTRAPLDNLTDILKKDILKKVVDISKLEAAEMYELMPSYQLEKKLEYSGGKKGIAPFALHSTNHVLTQTVDLKMNFGINGDLYNLSNIDSIDSQDGYRVLDWLSAMINAHVDVAKDPYIVLFNVNDTTYNMVNFLLRTGKGTTTFLFMPQQILKEFVMEIQTLNGEYGVDEKANAFVTNKVISNLYNKYEKLASNAIKNITSDTERSKAIEILNKYKAAKEDPSLENKLEAGFDKAMDNKSLEKALDEYRVLKNNPKSFEYYMQQLYVLNAYSALSKPATTLNQLVQMSQIDTKKYGNNLAQQLNFFNGVKEFINTKYNEFYLGSETGEQIEYDNPLSYYFETTFLNKKLNNGIATPRVILKNQLIQATTGFLHIYNYITKNLFGELEVVTEDGIIKKYPKRIGDKVVCQILSDQLESIIRSKAVKDIFNVNNTKIFKLFYGDNTMAIRLQTFKEAILAGEFPEMLTDGKINNEFLNYLFSHPADKSEDKFMPDRISVRKANLTNTSKHFTDEMTAYFSDLLDSEHDEIKGFARDLVLYAFLTSADNRGVSTFFHLVPHYYKKALGYIDGIKNLIDNLNEDIYSSNIIEEIDNPEFQEYPSLAISLARNLWSNDLIIPNIPDKFNKRLNAYNSAGRLGVSAFSVKKGKYNSRFVKVSANNVTSVENTSLFVKIGSVTTTDNVTNKVTKEDLYRVVEKLGYAKGAEKIYEYDKSYNEPSIFSYNTILKQPSIEEIKLAFSNPNTKRFTTEFTFDEFSELTLNSNDRGKISEDSKEASRNVTYDSIEDVTDATSSALFDAQIEVESFSEDNYGIDDLSSNEDLIARAEIESLIANGISTEAPVTDESVASPIVSKPNKQKGKKVLSSKEFEVGNMPTIAEELSKERDNTPGIDC